MPTRDERIRLQQYDNGDPNEKVWKRTGHCGTQATDTYHEDPGCVAPNDWNVPNLPDDTTADSEALHGAVRAAYEHPNLHDKTRAFMLRGTEAPCRDCVLTECDECGDYVYRGDARVDANKVTHCPACRNEVPHQLRLGDNGVVTHE